MNISKSSKKIGIILMVVLLFLLSACNSIVTPVENISTQVESIVNADTATNNSPTPVPLPNTQPPHTHDVGFSDKTYDIDTWIDFVFTLLDINPDNIIEIIDVLSLMVEDGVDSASIGIILIEDLIEFLDDAGGLSVFDDLWFEFMPQWIGWGSGFQAPLAFHFWNFNEPDEIPVDTSGLHPDFASWVEWAYGVTGVQWSEVPYSLAQINRLVNANVDPIVIGLIMVEDFLEFMDDYDASVIAFPCLWEQIIAFNWTINHRLSWHG